MNKSTLKANVTSTGSYFFTRDSMKFFGDTMSNYGVNSATIEVDGEDVAVWELSRKRPVKNGLQDSAYFDKTTYARILV